MPKFYTRSFHRTHLRLYRDNWDWIVSASDAKGICPTEMIREIVDMAVKHLRANADKKVDEALAELEEMSSEVVGIDIKLNDKGMVSSVSFLESPPESR